MVPGSRSMMWPAVYKAVVRTPRSSSPVRSFNPALPVTGLSTVMTPVVPPRTSSAVLFMLSVCLISRATRTPAQQIMLLSFRFSGVLSFLNPYYHGGQSVQLTRFDAGH